MPYRLATGQFEVVVGDGFEPPNSERAELQSAAFSHFATPPFIFSFKKVMVPETGVEPATY